MFHVKKSSLTFITFVRVKFELSEYLNGVCFEHFYSSDGCVYFCYLCRCTSPTGRMVQGGGAKGYTFSCGTQPVKRGKNQAKVFHSALYQEYNENEIKFVVFWHKSIR